jgi:hypothetical protein
MEKVGVECRFDPDGRVHVRRVHMDDQWQAAAQGRQWQDESGRHVLVMLPGERIVELWLSVQDLTWRLAPRVDRAVT